MYSNHPTVLLPFGQQKKGFIYPEEYFKEIEDSDYWLTKLFKLMARLLGNTYSGSGQEVFQGIADLFFCEISSDTMSSYSSIENSLFGLNTYLGIEFPHVDAVVDYCVRNPGFYDVFLYASILTKEEFGDNSQISVELYRDPECDDEYVSIYVRQDSYDNDILERIEEVCKEYEVALTDTSGWLLVTTDFKPKSL